MLQWVLIGTKSFGLKSYALFEKTVSRTAFIRSLSHNDCAPAQSYPFGWRKEGRVAKLGNGEVPHQESGEL